VCAREPELREALDGERAGPDADALLAHAPTCGSCRAVPLLRERMCATLAAHAAVRPDWARLRAGMDRREAAGTAAVWARLASALLSWSIPAAQAVLVAALVVAVVRVPQAVRPPGRIGLHAPVMWSQY
jgi:hypothetical protein